MRFISWSKRNWLLGIVLASYALLAAVRLPEAKRAAIIGVATLTSLTVTLVTVFVFIGLFQVWVREDFILKHLGEKSGFRGLALGALLGTAIHGPLVGVFPLLKTLLNKGARLGVVIAIVSTYAIKVPMIPLEIRFFGWRFTLVRQLLLFASAFVMAPIMERLIGDVPGFTEQKEQA